MKQGKQHEDVNSIQSKQRLHDQLMQRRSCPRRSQQKVQPRSWMEISRERDTNKREDGTFHRGQHDDVHDAPHQQAQHELAL